MPRQVFSDVQDDFSGGLNLAADASQLQPNELRRTDNCRLTEFRGLTKRQGTQRIHAAAIGSGNPVRAGYGWVHGSSVDQLAIANGTLYTGTVAVPMTWASQAGTLSTTAYPVIVGFRDGGADVAYIADGGLLNKWNGAALTTDIAGTPNTAFIAVHNLRLFGISGTDETLYWSALGNGDTLGNAGSGGGSAIIRTFGQQKLTALMPLGASLIIFHQTGISRFTGWSQDDFNVDAGTYGVSADVGTIAPKSLVQVENTGFFLTDRGFYEVGEAGVFGTSTAGVRPISTKIEPLIQSLSQTSFNRVQGVHNKANREVWWYLPDVGIYVYNYRLKAWSGPFDGIYTSQVVHSAWATTDSTTSPVILTGHADGFVRLNNEGGSDDVLSNGTGGTAYTMTAQLHRFFFNSPILEKSLRFIYVNAFLRGSASAFVEWVNSTTTASKQIPSTLSGLWDEGTWDSGGVWSENSSDSYRVHAWGRGEFTDVTISDTSTKIPVFSRLEAVGFNMGARY